jgi:hypothetical protein
LGIVFGVAGQAFFRFFVGRVCFFKSKYPALALFFHMLLSAAVAGSAALSGQSRVGPESKRFDHFFVASAARLRVFRLRSRLSRHSQPDGRNDRSAKDDCRNRDSVPLSFCFRWQLKPP